MRLSLFRLHACSLRVSLLGLLCCAIAAFYSLQNIPPIDHLDPECRKTGHQLPYSERIHESSQNIPMDTRPHHQICILGNSESVENALRTHGMWNGRFPSYWYVWGEVAAASPPQLPANVNVQYGDNKTAWSEGIHQMLAKLREIYVCEYFFTHDDDLHFTKNNQTPSHHHIPSSSSSSSSTIEISVVLSDILNEYKPAVAAFPWKVGDTSEAGMKSLAARYSHQAVAPLTGFDSGMVLYHVSIVDFFIPYMPTGQGGFVGRWSLCAHYLNMFAPLIFKERAIRINALSYINTINIDNTPVSERAVVQSDGDGLMVHGESRHPYEYHLNTPFKTFMASGLRNTRMRWGRSMASFDVTWTASPSSTAAPINKWDILASLNNFYDIRHPLISQNSYIKSRFSEGQLEEYASANVKFTFAIHIFTINRLASFVRLWESIGAATKISKPVSITIHLDFDATDMSSSLNYIKFLKSLRSAHGPTSLSVNTRPKGLRYNVLDSWTPTSTDEYAIFLEDDISVRPLLLPNTLARPKVSKHFLEYADQMVTRYFYSPDYHGGILGISLYNCRYNEVTMSLWAPESSGNVYINQQPQSWGAVYGPIQWSEFIKWYLVNRDTDPLIPNSYTNRWNQEKSWKKYLGRFMYAHGKWMVYPNLPDGLSFSTNHLEWGVNDRVTQAKREKMSALFTPPLLNLDVLLDPIKSESLSHNTVRILQSMRVKDGRLDMSAQTPMLKSLSIYNIYGTRMPTLASLKSPINPSAFDKCTLILTVYDRTATLPSRLAYYQHQPHLSLILVIWNNQQVPIPVLPAYKLPVTILQQRVNSLNNRFFPHAQITTDCVVNMDDDWDMPYAHTTNAIRVWRGHFFNHIVGQHHQGRSHSTTPPHTYLKANSLAVSIMLPSGMVYHRKYLDTYTHQTPAAARAIVDEVMNCDDILFNFVVANATRSGPVVMESWARGIDMDPMHVAERSACINRFKLIFGGIPLRFTTSFFRLKKGGGAGLPGLKDFKSR